MKHLATGIVTLLLLGAVGFFYFVRPDNVSVVRVNSSNPALQKAVTEARNGLPEFWKKVAEASEEHQSDFAVKVAFDTDQGPEFLWIRGPLVRREMVSGTLDQVPIAYRKARRGELVRFSEADIVDWMVRNPDGTTSGGLTDAVLAPK